ncbi:DUF4760 domain-containing protein [Undibacterium sp. Ji49W]|uniref:DUF4760 domain-containing protein n=1 Tax=Undibacterium sp. Ji49W TaxID=3413040 RepID=UPI003BF31537
MSMTTEVFNAWYILLQVVIGVAVIATFMVYYFQLLAMRKATLGQNLFAIHTFVFEESFRQDRSTLLTLGESGKLFKDWTTEERRAAERVCAAYDLVALTVSYGVVPFNLISDLRYSMTKCHNVAEPLLKEVRMRRTPDLWHHFTSIVKRF